MNASRDPCDDGDLAHLTPCTPAEALRREPVSLEVDDDTQLALSPMRRSQHRYFARVRLSGFADLQVLGLVPRRIKEQAVRTAIASDDEQALRLATDRLARGGARPPARCGCAGEGAGEGEAEQRPGPQRASFTQELDAAYREIRRDYHPALARVLSEHHGVELAWNSPLAASVKGWASKVSRESLSLVGLFQDITIGRKATLELTPASRVLLARSIRIHREGRLVHRGAYLRLWANSIESYLDLLPAITTGKPLWALDR